MIQAITGAGRRGKTIIEIDNDDEIRVNVMVAVSNVLAGFGRKVQATQVREEAHPRVLAYEPAGYLTD